MLKRAALTGVSQVVRLALPVVFLPLATRQLSSEAVGGYLLHLQLAGWFAIVAEFGAPFYLYGLLARRSRPRLIQGLFWSDYAARLLAYLVLAPVLFALAFAMGRDPVLAALAVGAGWMVGSGVSIVRQFAGSLWSIALADGATVCAYALAIGLGFMPAPSPAAALASLLVALAVGQAIQLAIDRPARPASLKRLVARLVRHVKSRWPLVSLRATLTLGALSIIPMTGLLVGTAAAGQIGPPERLFAVVANLSVVAIAALTPAFLRLRSLDARRAERAWLVCAAVVGLAYAAFYALATYQAGLIESRLFGRAEPPSHYGWLAVIYLGYVLECALLNGLIAPLGRASRLLVPAIAAIGLQLALALLLRPMGLTGMLLARATAQLVIVTVLVIVAADTLRAGGTGRRAEPDERHPSR